MRLEQALISIIVDTWEIKVSSFLNNRLYVQFIGEFRIRG